MKSPGESRPTCPFPEEEYALRTRRLTKQLDREDVDAFIIITEINRQYFTGFKSSNGILVASRNADPVFYTDSRYIEMARNSIKNGRVSELGRKPGEFRDTIAQLAKRGKWRKAAYEGIIPALLFHELKGAMPEGTALSDGIGIIRELRAVKSHREQAVMRKAAKLNDVLFARVIEKIRPGMSEWDIRCVIRTWADRLGQGEAFESIACVGSNASKCHHHPSERVLKQGQELLLDFGIVVGGYLSDMTRPVFYGKPSRKLKEIHKIVLDANRRAVSSIRAGRRCRTVDASGRRIIEAAGFGKRFGHGLGHGVGLEIHEHPSFSTVDKSILQPGMIVTVEPGIYLPGVGGVRIEDMVLVKSDGCEVLSSSPRSLIID